MSYTHLYGNLTVLGNLANEYYSTNDNSQKEIISQNLRDIIITNDYSMNLGLNKSEVKTISTDLLIFFSVGSISVFTIVVVSLIF